MRRYVPLLIAGSAFIAAACSDSVAPTRSTNESDLPTLSAFGGGPLSSSARANRRALDHAATITFTIYPHGGRAIIGGFTLRYDANAVCDPDQSSYGPSEWSKDCPTLNRPITVTAKFWMEDGRTHADFSPDIRFDPDKDVFLTAMVPSLRGQRITDEIKAQYSIWYSVVVGDTRYFVDEVANNPELATYFVQRGGRATGTLIRKIYHFSGYYVRSGRLCEDGSVDPECSGDEPAPLY